MSAVEEIQAAIEKLTAIAYSASDGPWVAHVERTSNEITAELFDANGGYVVSDGYVADLELIEILHRTIDAQLAILEVAVAYGELGEGSGSRFIIAALLLARAINGTTS